ncbi:MAG: imidazole glycerol phosphate synthase subunit HisF [Bacteroidota bacterium]|jgi:cyclase
MALKRIIARLDIKQNRLIKGMHLEGWRFLPEEPQVYCSRFYSGGIDEIIYIDVVASLYGRDKLTEIVRSTTDQVFVPITAGGGVRSLADATDLLRSGADKVAVCTGVIREPSLIGEISNRYGAQCCVVSIQAKKNRNSRWDAYYDIGRENSGRDAVEWAVEAAALGAGELLITSIDREGTRKGFDLELISEISAAVNIPVIASGGLGRPEHAPEALSAGADAVAVAYGLHYGVCNISQIKDACRAAGFEMR